MTEVLPKNITVLALSTREIVKSIEVTASTIKKSSAESKEIAAGSRKTADAALRTERLAQNVEEAPAPLTD